MGTNLLNLPDESKSLRHAHGFSDDFDHYVTADRWTSIATDSGSVQTLDSAGGILELDGSDGSVADNDEAYAHTTEELFLFAANKPLIFEAYVQFTEANTDDANILVGLMDAAAANHLLDDGGGPAASYSGCVFFKQDGQTLWTVENSITTTQKTTQLTAANSLDGTAKTAGGASYQRLRIEVQPHGGSSNDFSFYVDDVLVAKHKDQTYSSATEMNVIFGVKNGDANLEKLLVDYVFCYQKR